MAQPWIVDLVGAELFEKLAAELSGSELQSLLLEVLRRRAAARDLPEVLAQFHRDKFVRPSPIELRASLAVDRHLLDAAAKFEALELSPVAPLGTCSTMAPTDQHRVLGALRGTEVVSDPTNVLALECAARLRASPEDEIHLTTTQRVIRAQPVPDKPGFAQHFRIWVLASAARERKDHAFAVAALTEHIETMLRALDSLEADGHDFGVRRIDLLAREDRAAIADRVASAVGAQRKVLDHAYYSGGVRYMLWVTNKEGHEVPLGDGGLFDWVARLTHNQRNVYVASGLGAQLVPFMFRR